MLKSLVLQQLDHIYCPHLSAGPTLLCLRCRNHATLNSFQAIAAVRRIVLGYGRRNPDAPFTRNLNFVVAYLLAVLGLEREEDVFWILVALLEQCLHPSCVLEVSLYAPQSSLCWVVVRLHSRVWAALQLWPACTFMALHGTCVAGDMEDIQLWQGANPC